METKMTTEMLAVVGRMNPVGMLSLTLIPVIFVMALCYSRGLIVGSATCLLLFFASLWLTGTETEGMINQGGGWITNKSQTKWIKKPSGASLSYGHAFFCILDRPGVSRDVSYYIPHEELMVNEVGKKLMKPDGREIEDDDYYIFNKTYARANAGGSGGNLPQWLYHPAAVNWPLLIGALPVMLVGGFIKSQVSD